MGHPTKAFLLLIIGLLLLFIVFLFVEIRILNYVLQAMYQAMTDSYEEIDQLKDLLFTLQYKHF